MDSFGIHHSSVLSRFSFDALLSHHQAIKYLIKHLAGHIDNRINLLFRNVVWWREEDMVASLAFDGPVQG